MSPSRSRRVTRPALGAVAATLAVTTSLALGPSGAQAQPGSGEGGEGIHEPSLSTGHAVFMLGSGDLLNAWSTRYDDWSVAPVAVFNERQEWWAAYSPDLKLWSPDISRTDPGDPETHFHVYYTVSSPDSSRSAIGLATEHSNFLTAWTDHGEVYSTDASDDHAAADPNLFVDEDDTWWLAFGTDRNGIKLLELDPATGKPTDDTPLHSLAADDSGIQSPYLTRHGDYYYLFNSHGTCDDWSLDSTCHIKVGRATHPTGPYLDANGIDLMNGGGTTILATEGSHAAPGGQSMFGDRLMYTYLDAEDNGARKLGQQNVDWSGGWPTLAGPPAP